MNSTYLYSTKVIYCNFTIRNALNKIVPFLYEQKLVFLRFLHYVEAFVES